MHSQREKYHLLTFISLGLAVIFTFISIIKTMLVLIFFSFALLAISIISDALFLYLTYQKVQSIKQFVRGVTLFLLIAMLLFYVLRL